MTETNPSDQTPPRKYRAFISYSHKDEAWAKWLHVVIETYRTPRSLVGRDSRFGQVPKRLQPVFRDRDELTARADLSAAIQDALRDSEYLVVICSPAAKASRWVNAEIALFQKLGLGDRIVCLLASGNPSVSFPPALMDADNREPLAADPRPDQDGRDLAKLKIIASLLGVSLDDLRQRERRRRMERRLLFGGAIVSGAFAVMAIYIGLCDAGAPMPGRIEVQTVLDRHDASIFRAVPRLAAIQSGLANERRALIDRIVKEMRGGNYRFELPAEGGAPPRKGIDTWSLVQGVAAILKSPEATTTDRAEAIRWLEIINEPEWRIEAKGVKYGWESWEGRGYTMAPPALWNVIALTVALGRPDLLTADQKQRFEAALQWAEEATIIYHPRDDGGWNTYPNERDLGAHDTYSAVMALKALLAAKEVGLGWLDQPELRDHLIGSTRAYLISQFEGTGGDVGWSSDIQTKNLPLDGLMWEAAVVLLQAELDGYGGLPTAIDEALRTRLIQLNERPFTFPISGSRFYRIFVNERGQEFNVKNATAFLWYPYAVQGCGRWLRRAAANGAAAEDVTRIRRSLGHLAIDLQQELLEEGKSGEPFRVAESLFSLSSIAP